MYWIWLKNGTANESYSGWLLKMIAWRNQFYFLVSNVTFIIFYNFFIENVVKVKELRRGNKGQPLINNAHVQKSMLKKSENHYTMNILCRKAIFFLQIIKLLSCKMYILHFAKNIYI